MLLADGAKRLSNVSIFYISEFKINDLTQGKIYFFIDHVANSLPHSLAINPLSPSECQTSFNSYNPNSAVCGRAQGNPCDVDAGSALACTRGNGRYLLKGIYSGETGCGANQLMSFTKMDVDFIKGSNGGSDEKSLPINQNINSNLPSFGARLQVPQQPQQFQQQQQQPQRTSYSYPEPTQQAQGYLPPNFK